VVFGLQIGEKSDTLSAMSRIRLKTRREKGRLPTPGAATSKTKLLAILTAIVCIIVLAVHWRAMSAEALTFDDNQYFTENPLVQNPSIESGRRFLSEVLRPSSVEGYYQPLTMISLMFDYALGGRADNLRPIHRTSLILHIMNTALVIIFIYLLFGVPWTAAAAGLLFGLHPMTVEVIAWVGERKTLLATFFALWCLICYVRFAKGGGWKFYLGCLAAYILALMSKPTSLPLPMLLVLLDWWPLKRLSRRTLIEKIPLFAIGGVWAVITVISQSSTATLAAPAKYELGRVALTLCHNIIFYPAKMLCPVNLSPHYIFPEPMNLSNPMVLFGVMGTCVLIPLLLISLRWTRGAVIGWLFFFIAILPTMQILQFSNVIASDKFAYLPSIGLLAALAAFGGWFCEAGGAGKYGKRCLITVLAVLILGGAEAAATVKYLGLWQNTFSLYEHMLSLTPNSPPLHFDIANVLTRQGKLDEAIGHYKRALAIELKTPESLPPDFYIAAHFNLANTLKSAGKAEEAVYYYNKAIGYYRQTMLAKPNKQKIPVELAKALTNLANAYSEQGKSQEAIKCYREAIQFNPNSAITCSNLGWELKNIKEPDEALVYFRKAQNLNPKMVSALVGMAQILATHPDPQKRQPDNAVGFAMQAAELTGYREIPALETLAEAYAAAGRFDKAVETMQIALDLAVSSRNDIMAGRIREQLKQYQRPEKGN
jgi:tetratricopeptide (TPR) repeat protein